MKAGPHEWAGNGYHCETCGASYHCPKCNDGCGMMGHLHTDAEGDFHGCQEPERMERWRTAFFAKLSKGRR